MNNSEKLEQQAMEIQAVTLETLKETIKNAARFQFASAALVGILSNWEGRDLPPRRGTAIAAFEYADAMVVAASVRKI
jgi:uncharacterized protein (DUF2267 family)